MKELYFTKDTISSKAKEFTEYSLVKTPKFQYKPENSALIILDMQRYFLDENSHAFVPSSLAIIPKIKSLLNYYIQNNYCVIFTKHMNNLDNAGLMSKWWKGFLSDEDELNQIIYDLDATKSLIIGKSQYDAFYNTDLELYLKEKDIEQVVITGVMTHLCCETTARSAFIRGFEPFFVIDGTATYNENYHKSTILNLSHGFAIPVLTEQLMGNSI